MALAADRFKFSFSLLIVAPIVCANLQSSCWGRECWLLNHNCLNDVLSLLLSTITPLPHGFLSLSAVCD